MVELSKALVPPPATTRAPPWIALALAWSATKWMSASTSSKRRRSPRSITVWRVCTYVPTNEHLELPYDTGEGASGSARTAASCGREAARKPRLRRGRSAWRSRELVVAALSHAGASHRDAAARRALSRRAVRLPALAVTRRRFSATPSLRDAVSPRRRFSATPFLRDAISPRRHFSATPPFLREPRS